MSHPRSSTQKGKDSCSYPSSCSLFSKDKVAETIRSVRKEAVSSPTYVGSVLPYGYGCVRKQEKVVFPDGTVYSLTASWVADPTLAMLQEAGLQTSPEKAKVSDKEVNTPQFYNAWSIVLSVVLAGLYVAVEDENAVVSDSDKRNVNKKLFKKARINQSFKTMSKNMFFGENKYSTNRHQQTEPLRKEKTYETKIREEVETVLVINSDDDDVKMKQEPEEVKLKAESCSCVSDSESHVSFTDQRLKDYAGTIPRRRLIPDMDEYKRVTLSPKPYRVEKYNSTRKRLPSPHSPIKKALSPSAEVPI
ncbi:unnamed protein product [Mytilus edulis]|uniref:Uncharacterized protein n=1 Tax=Mytilus edulis TaxID=6550 RepID=A0A8S3RTE6_MYTED|nr:unnamed protein product [Mytilus edulis]